MRATPPHRQRVFMQQRPSCGAPPRKRASGGPAPPGETGLDTTYATGTSPSRNVSANGAATCVTC